MLILVPCFRCEERCTDLTDELGCAGDQCLETCRSCITGIDWDDYAGGQDVECQCHNNGCDQCEDGWFKVDFDFPCQPCDEFIGCMHCTDFLGCQQCEEGYTLVEDDECGEDSYVGTGGKVHYCVPDDGGSCTTGGGGEGPAAVGCPDLTAQDGCMYDEHCLNCQSWGGCLECEAGYFVATYDYACVSCSDGYEGVCNSCSDWNGCTDCADGLTPTWDNTCGTNGLNVCA